MKSLGGLTALLVLSVAAIGALVLVVSLIGSGEAAPKMPRLDPTKTTPLIRVENKVITEFYLDLARQYHLMRAGKEGYVMPDHGILLEAMSLAAWEEILRRYDRPVLAKDVAEERARGERESKDRDTLRRIVGLLDGYPGMYEEIFVRPGLANNRIHKLHQDRTVQKEAYAKAEEGLKEALRNPDYFRKKSEEDPETHERVDSRDPRIGRRPEDHFPPEEMERNRKQILDFAAKWLSRTAPGEVCPQIVDDMGSYVILRLIERSPDHAVYELVSFRKMSFDAWFEGELKKMKVEVVDPAIRAMLKEKLKNPMFERWLFGDNPQ